MFTYINNQGHGESVYNLINAKDDPSPNPPLYRSRYSQFVREEAKCKKVGANQTMGVSKECLYPPDNYLRKRSRAPTTIRPSGSSKERTVLNTKTDSKLQKNAEKNEKDSADPKECQDSTPEQEAVTCQCCLPKDRVRSCCNEMPKPPLPKTCSCILGSIPKGDRDFIRANAVKVVRQPASVPERRYVYHRDGHTAMWDESGYANKYLYKKNYGQVPRYLECVKERLRNEEKQRIWKLEQPKRHAREKIHQISKEERETILSGLETKWEEVYNEYQSMPLLIDSASRIRQRCDLEKRLKSLERDIQLIERHNHIFVADTDTSFYLA